MIKYISKIRKKGAYIKHSVGLITWATKSYEVWLILQNLLYLTRPKKLVEFGSGRSTSYLAEYALKTGAELISIEQYFCYFLRVNLGLKLSFLPFGAVRYVPVRGDWYNVNAVKKYLSSFDGIDFLFIDGPTGLKAGNRDSEKFDDVVIPYLDNVKMIVIDDVQRKGCDSRANDLAERLRLRRYDIKYNNEVGDILAFLLSENASEKISELPAYLRILLKQRS